MSDYTATPSSFPTNSKITGLKLADWEDLLDAISDSWTDFTASLGWTGTLGNGAALARYKRLGHTVKYRGAINWNTTTSHGAATQKINLPVTALDLSQVGHGYAFDQSTAATRVPLVANLASTTQLQFVAGGTTGPVSNLIPMTWASGDVLLWYIEYEV